MPAITQPQSADATLIKQTLSGNDRAFRDLVNRYLSIVYNFIYRMTQNQEVSEEMTQETFVKVYNNLKSFDTARPLKPWILRIASNTTLTALRKQSKVVSLDAMIEDGHWNEASHQLQEDTSVRLERKLTTDEISSAIHKLDEKYRQVLLLRYQDDLSYEEIADTMGVPLNTVRTWLKRGLEKLKAHLSPEYLKESAR